MIVTPRIEYLATALPFAKLMALHSAARTANNQERMDIFRLALELKFEHYIKGGLVWMS